MPAASPPRAMPAASPPRTIPSGQAVSMLGIKKTLAWCYISAPLYVQVVGGEYHMFKPPGLSTGQMVKDGGYLPRQLYIRHQDKLDSIPEVQAQVTRHLAKRIAQDDHQQAKQLLVDMVEESFQEPRAQNFQGLAPTVKVLVQQYSQRGPAIRELALLANKNYGSAVHAVNVAALTLAYCFKHGFAGEISAEYGLAAMLHDIGKLAISDEILNAPRPLSPREFEMMKSHPEEGLRLIKGHGFSRLVEEAVLEHHERLNGQGYPKGKSKISLAGRVIGIIDSYEALTSDERPYRRPLSCLEAIELMHQETREGKFDLAVFKSFAYCLT
ncbi:MAG: HD domain-containing protein [Desulfarculus sp.]|nr:HD domain-containing protein [Desulfarculus sp.]